MECTFINHGFAPSVTQCDQYDHKNSYSSLALGGQTKFTLLYADFRYGAEDYPNKMFEGNIMMMTKIDSQVNIDIFIDWNL